MKIAVPIISSTEKAALEDIKKANKIADFLEIRIDYLKNANLEKLLKASKKSVILTLRSKKEGGKFKGTEKKRTEILLNYIKFKPDFVDIEFNLQKKLRSKLISQAKKFKVKVILSYHNFKETPSKKKLESLFNKMKKVKGVEVIKIVTKAKKYEDNFNVLGLFKKTKNKLIAFCMGNIGVDSRILSLLLGGFLTFASLESGKESAAGQIPIKELKKIYSQLEKW